MAPKMIRFIPVGAQAGRYSFHARPGYAEAQRIRSDNGAANSCRRAVWEVAA